MEMPQPLRPGRETPRGKQHNMPGYSGGWKSPLERVEKAIMKNIFLLLIVSVTLVACNERSVETDPKVEKAKIEAEKDVEKARAEAEKKKAEADAKVEKAKVDAETKP